MRVFPALLWALGSLGFRGGGPGCVFRHLQTAQVQTFITDLTYGSNILYFLFDCVGCVDFILLFILFFGLCGAGLFYILCVRVRIDRLCARMVYLFVCVVAVA